MTSAMARSISRWPHVIIVCSPMAPAQKGTSRTANGTYIEADISAMPRHEWPRNRIHAPMPIAMLVAITMTPTSGRAVSAGHTQALQGAEHQHPGKHRHDHLEVVPDEVPHAVAPVVRSGVPVGYGTDLSRHGADRRTPRCRCQVPFVMTQGHDRDMTCVRSGRAPARGGPPGCGRGHPACRARS